MFKIKLSPRMRPFVSRVSTNGLSQRAFTNVIGRPAGQCVKSAVRKGMSSADIRKAVRTCGKGQAGEGKVRNEIARLRSAG